MAEQLRVLALINPGLIASTHMWLTISASLVPVNLSPSYGLFRYLHPCAVAVHRLFREKRSKSDFTSSHIFAQQYCPAATQPPIFLKF